MDFATFLGLVLGWGSVFACMLIEGGKIQQFVKESAFILIIGGTFGATMISFTMEQILDVMGIAKHAFFGKRIDIAGLVETMVHFADKSRRDGLLALENELSSVKESFLQNGMRLVLDGNDSERVRSILETEISFLEQRHKVGENMFGTLGGFAPTLGIIGTVMGLIFALSGGAEDPAETVKAIAAAFLATFYGIAFANLIFLPIASKLKLMNEHEILAREVMLEGILSIQAGETPRIVEEKLKVFLPPKKRTQLRGKKASAAPTASATGE
jgi:chemotaxis protein MotA